MKVRTLVVILVLLLSSQVASTLLTLGGPSSIASGGPGGTPGPMAEGRAFSDLGGADEPVFFTNVSDSAGLGGISGNYFAWGDYNGDGYQDLLINGRRLMRNGGPPGWAFTDVTAAAGLDQALGVNVGIWGDYDNDGDLDVYLAGGGWTTDTPTEDDYLFRNEGDGTFTDVTASAGNPRDAYPSTAAAWGDIDGDGHLDLYVANYESGSYVGYPDSLWHNEGDGTFTDVSASSGIRSAGREPGRGVAFCDFDDDGDADIHVSNYRIRPNFLWQNDGSGHFTNVAPAKGVTGDASYYQTSGPYYGHTIGASWADWNNDGLMDIWEANLVHKYVGAGDIRGYICDDSKFYVNNGPPAYDFTDVRPSTGIKVKPTGGAGTYIGDELYDGIAWADFDHDGDLDVFMPQVYNLDYSYSYLYLSNGDGTFRDVGPAYGLRVWNTYGAAWADYDRDGDLDLVTGGQNPLGEPARVHLFRNSGNANRWLRVEVEGTVSNAMGLGARVTVRAGNTTMTRDFEGGTGSHAQMNDLTVEFGLGRADRASTVTVRFPSGHTLSFLDVAANTTLRVKEVDPGEPVSFTVRRSPAWEDEDIQLSTSDVAATSGPYTGYYWDTDGDWEFELRSNSSWVDASWPQQGVYPARMAVAREVDGQSFCVISEAVPVDVRNLPPTAEAGEYGPVGEDEVLVLDGSGSNDTPSDLPGLLFLWEVDGMDRGWSTSPTTEVSWPEAGEHSARLFVMDDDGEIASDPVALTVENRAPVVTAPPDVTVNEDEPVTIAATATDAPSDMEGVRYRIHFGDGNATGWMQTAERTYIYRVSGVMRVRIDARDGDDAIGTAFFNITVVNVDPMCTIDLDLSRVDEDEEFSVHGACEDTYSDLETLRWRFDFGDGTGSEWRVRPVEETTHSYARAGTYTVTLTVMDDDGAQGSSSKDIQVLNVAPTVSLSGPSRVVAEDEEVTLTATGGDTPSDATGLLFRWDLGDGNVLDWSTVSRVEHSYPSGATYVVEVRVRDDDGAEDLAETPVKVENRPPVVQATQSATDVLEDGTVTFDASGTTDTPSDRDGLVIEWQAGGRTASGATAEFSWASAGSYTVVLRATDGDGAISELFLTVTVRNRAPAGDASVDRTEAQVDEIFNFAVIGLDDTPSDLPDLIVTWAFGDGTLETGTTVTHKYRSPGDYTVTLTIRDDDAAQVERVLLVTVHADEGMMSGSSSLLALIMAVIVVAVLLVVVLYMRGGFGGAPDEEEVLEAGTVTAECPECHHVNGAPGGECEECGAPLSTEMSSPPD